MNARMFRGILHPFKWIRFYVARIIAYRKLIRYINSHKKHYSGDFVFAHYMLGLGNGIMAVLRWGFGWLPGYSTATIIVTPFVVYFTYYMWEMTTREEYIIFQNPIAKIIANTLFILGIGHLLDIWYTIVIGV